MANMRKEKFIKRFFASKAFFLFGLIILSFLIFALTKKIFESREINREIENTEQEIARLEKRNSELGELLNYLNTNNFLEQEARLKFNMQRQGESVMVVPGSASESAENNEYDIDEREKLSLSNPKKWWNYFFSQNN